MTYNIHPIIVHFPIALLFLYSLIKIIPFKKWFPNVAWRQIERMLLLVGVLSIFVASSTGEFAAESGYGEESIIESHEFFANTSTWLYGLILIGEVLIFINISLIYKLKTSIIKKISIYLEKILTNPVLSKWLAFFGLIALSVTGLLGGVMVYGTSADPLAPIVLKLLGITY